MRIMIHRGARQIGGTCIELAAGTTRLILDLGQNLQPVNGEKQVPFQELPKVSGLYKGEPCEVTAVLFSHYHGDHVGLIEYIHPDIPIYMGEATAKVMNMTAQFVSSRSAVQPAAYFISGQPLKIGDFTVTPYLVDHSAYDAYAFVIQADDQCVVYTGDLRMHGKKAKATWFFLKHLPQQVDALLLEGTMMSRSYEAVKTEEQIEQEAYEFMNQKNKPVFVLQSAVNIDRLVGMYRAANRSKRLFVMDIFTANIVAELGEKIPNPNNFKNIRVFYPYFLTQRMFKDEAGAVLMNRFRRYKILREELGARQDYCMLIRDTMLSDLQHIKNITGSGLICSLWRGYLQTERSQRLLQCANLMNMDIIQLHTSGHADLKTLHKIVANCKPDKVIPVHTEWPERYISEFAKVEVLQDGQILALS